MKALIIFCAIVWFTPQTLAASDAVTEVAKVLQGTVFVIPAIQSEQGDPAACGFEFAAIAFDYAYKQGAPIRLSGSLTIKRYKKSLYLAYKLGVFDLGKPNEKPEPPFSAWMQVGSTIIKPAKKTEANTPGYALFIAPLPNDLSSFLDSLAQQKEVKVGFNRVNKGLDVVVALDMSVRDTSIEKDVAKRERDDKLGAKIVECAGDLAKFALSQP